MRAYYCDHFVLSLPVGHRFPMEKYRLLRRRVAAELEAVTMLVPPPARDVDLTRVHAHAYVRDVVEGTLSAADIRRLGFPWSPGLVERSRRSVGGTIEAARQALATGRAVNLAGGTHHAFPDRGEGFCVFNDVAVATRTLQAEDGIARVAIVDLDVHQGNGTAFIFRDDPSVFTTSVHGANNFPFHKEVSRLDIGLPDRSGDDAFLAAATRVLEAALAHGPELVFYVAGADAHEGDRLGRLSVTKAGLAQRDHLVVEACSRAGIPLATVMSGGYGHDVTDTVDIHFHSVRATLQAMRTAA